MPGSVPVMDACSGLTGSVFKLGSDRGCVLDVHHDGGGCSGRVISSLECRIMSLDDPRRHSSEHRPAFPSSHRREWKSNTLPAASTVGMPAASRSLPDHPGTASSEAGGRSILRAASLGHVRRPSRRPGRREGTVFAVRAVLREAHGLIVTAAELTGRVERLGGDAADLRVSQARSPRPA